MHNTIRTQIGTFTYRSVSVADPNTNEATLVRFDTSASLDRPAFVAWLNSKVKQGIEGAGDIQEVVVNCDSVVFYLANRVQDEDKALEVTKAALLRIQDKVRKLNPKKRKEMLSPCDMSLKDARADFSNALGSFQGVGYDG